MIEAHHKALVFDCDGTLADTMPVHYEAWIATLKRYALDHLFPHDRFMSLGGVPAVRILEELSREGGVAMDCRAVSLEKERAYIEAASNVCPIEPVLAIARDNRGKLPMAVATGGHRDVAEHTLGAIGVLDWFDAVVSADDVTHPKPHPETFLKCAQAMGVSPQVCLAFEDAEPGLAAARAAGMDVVDVRRLLHGQPPPR